MQSQEFSNLILLVDELVNDTEAFYSRVKTISKYSLTTKKINEIYSSDRLSEVVGPERDTEDVHTWYSWKSALHLDFCLFDATREIVPSAVGLFTK